MGTSFIVVQVLILAFLGLHDWVPLGKLNDLPTLRRTVTTRENLLTTIFNLLPAGLALGLTLYFQGSPMPVYAKALVILAYGILCLGAFFAWWRPYLFGKVSPEMDRKYGAMFGTTHTFLPKRGHQVVPNTIHCLFHTCAVIALAMAISL